MLFNSYIFIFIFLPICLSGFFILGSAANKRVATGWVVVCSLFFYAWWNPKYLVLIIFSVLFNYSFGALLSRNAGILFFSRKQLLILGVSINLALIAYFKYANFFVDTVNQVSSSHFHLDMIILPLAISFFTFQQITYLVDAYKGETREYNFLNYCLFVTFFPQLIAGPIVHHREMLPQFAKDSIYKFNYSNLLVGITIFFIGLFKKSVIADGISIYSTPVFYAASKDVTITFFEAWLGSLAYTFQLYFDFSGYSDMAIGLGRMFGIKLPLNFYSPYKAKNIIEFWSRWHMTLSRFLKDYLYIPLGGNRRGQVRRYINLMITMLLGGLWHGAAWTFILWGGMHGFLLIVNRSWHKIRKSLGHDLGDTTMYGILASRLLTFLLVVVTWSIFRAENLEVAIQMLKAMSGLNGFLLPDTYQGYLNNFFSLGDILADLGWRFEAFDRNEHLFHGIIEMLPLFLLTLMVWFLPNTVQLLEKYKPAFDTYTRKGDITITSPIQWRLNNAWALFMAVVTLFALLGVNQVSEFLYFDF